MPVSFIKCFQYWNNVGKRGWKDIKDPHCIKNCDFSRNSIHVEFFSKVSTSCILWLSEWRTGKLSVWDSWGHSSPCRDSAPGSEAAWPCRGMGSEPSAGREGGSAAGTRAELGVLPLQSQLMDLPRLLHLSLPFFSSRDAPAENFPYWALFLPWKAFYPSQRFLMCTPCLSHSLQGMPQGNNPQAQIQGPCINHIPTGPFFWKLSILNQFMLAFALLKHFI